jgi:hypothetical protein
MDNGTMKDYIEDLIIKVNDACKAMEEAEILVAGLRETIKDLTEHLGEALYSDEWNTREYAIVAHSKAKEMFTND